MTTNGKATPTREKIGSSQRAMAKLRAMAPTYVQDRRKGTDDRPKRAEVEKTTTPFATAADLEREIGGISYLLRDWLPWGMLTGVLAAKGTGKTAFLMSIAHTIVTGRPWFNGKDGPPKSSVVWVQTENEAALIVSRLKNWRIPRSRILFPLHGQVANLENEVHLGLIQECVEQSNASALIIDTLRGAHKGDENNSKTQAVLANVASIAESTGCAAIVSHHTRKMFPGQELTLDSARGSNAITAAMKAIIGLDRPNPKTKWVRIRMVVENLGIAPEPVGMLITKTGLEFGKAPQKEDSSAKYLIKNWVVDELADQVVLASDMWEKAKAYGYCERTVRTAIRELGVVVKKQLGKGGKWTWKLPEDHAIHANESSKNATE